MRSLFLFISFIIFSAVNSQTLYWVGGSGNFNDSRHWSLSSNGPSANFIPSSNTDVIFDDMSGFDNTIIHLVGTSQVKSFYAKNTFNRINFTGSTYDQLTVSGDFILNQSFKPLLESKLIFNSLRTENNTVDFHGNSIKGNIYFNNGTYTLKTIQVGSSNSIHLNKGVYTLDHSSLSGGDIIINEDYVKLISNSAILYGKNKIELGSKALLTGANLKIIGNKDDPSLFKINPSVNLGNTELLRQSPLACSLTYTRTDASCFNLCDGSFTLSLSAGCTTGPYTLNINSAAPCVPSVVTGVNGSYILSSICATACAGATADFILQDVGGVVAFLSNQVLPQNPTNIQALFSNATPPKCFGLCNGSVTANVFGGSGPYNIFINPAIPGPTLGGLNPFTNTVIVGLCAGLNTFSVSDTKGCSKTFTNNQPTLLPLNSNSVLTTVQCFGQCTGSLTISPTGGTSGYTVSFSPGGTFTVPAAGSASTTGMCAGVTVSATIKDANACTLTVSGNITQPPLVNVTPTQTNLTCNAVCNGAASVAVTGGVSPYTYSWVPAGSTNAGVTGLCAGTQTVTIKNNGGQCTNTQTFNIIQPTSITITPTVTNISCNGFCTGSASVSAIGGTGPKTFTWVAPGPSTISTTSVISGQCVGTYTVFAQDNNACTVSAVITITAAPAFTTTSNTQSVICFSQCSGAATVNVSGGNPPYTYTWSPATASTVAGGTTTGSNLCLGNYTVTIKDASLCAPAPVVLNIQQAPPINPNITTTSVTCNGLCNGSINSVPSNGVGAYSFTLVTPASVSITTNPPYAGLCAGLYTLYIKDQNCRQSFTVSIVQPNPLVASVNVNTLTCFNVCNGSLAGSVNGGNAPYTFLWTTSTGTVAGPVIGSLCAGTYTFKGTDVNGCSTSSIVTLTQPTAITATINPTNPTCNSLCNGALSAVVAGGTPGYTLNWSNGVTGTPNPSLCAGNYTLNVTDSKGCTSPFTATLTAPSLITLTVITKSPVCSGNCNGSATVTASGGTPSYTYQFNTTPVTTNTTGIKGGLCAGNYITNVTDANGCSQSINFSIINPPVLNPSLTGLQSSCTNCTGSATVTPSGGVPGYTVSWTNSVSVVVGTGTAIANLCVGNYTAAVTDAQGCVATVTANVVRTVSVTIVTGGTPIQCFGACTGSAVANPSGGTGIYTYTWSPTGPPTQTTQTAVNLCAGNYTVFVKDGLGCVNSATISLNNPAAIVVNTTQTNATCFGNCNGAISATATGGTGPLTYSWSPGGQSTSSINSLCAGGYTLTVKDGNNCQKVLTFSVTQSNSIAATFTTTQPSGCGINNGSICATPNGGLGGPYNFTWSPVGGNASCATGLGAGVYSLVITDGAGCTASLSSLLTNPTGPTLTIGTTSVACNGGNTGSATVTAMGTAPFGFSWTPNGTGFVNIGNVSIGSGLNSGTYAISVSQSNSCITTQTINIATAPAFTVSSNVSDPKCNASCNGSITLVTSGGTPGYTFAWSSPTITGVGTQTVTNLCAGPYTVNITDANSCVKTQVFNLNNPPAIVLTNTASNVKCFGVCNGSIVANATGGTPALSYTWLPVAGFTGSSTATVLNLCPAVYTVNAIDGNGCTATNTINITQPAALLTSTLTSLNATCSNSCNATATLVAAGGTPGYAYSWSASGAVTSTLGGLCPGTYSGTVSDLKGCSVVKTFTVTAPAPFTATLNSANPLCNSACNGSIATTLSGAQGTVSFNWTPAAVGQNPTGLCAANYTLVATDAAGCVVSAVTSLIDPPAILANVTTTNPACNNNCNGIALSTPANAIGAVTYSWIPTGPPTQTAQTANGLCAGNYTLTIKDANACQDVQTFTLNNPPLLNVNPSSAPASCSFSNGAITLVVSGGTPTYNFSWSPSVSTTSVANGLGAGIYTVVVVDSKNCTNTVTIPLSNSNGPSSAPVTSSSISCNALCTGAASINPAGITGGTPGYTINWISPPSPSTVNPLVNLCAGTYSAQITDAMSCILFTAVTISQPAPITINPNIGLPTCNGICNGSVNLNPTGGTPGYQYTWTPPAANSSVITNVCAGTLTVQVKDNNLCLLTQTISVPGVQNITITTNTTSNVCFGNCTGSATVTSISNGIPPFTENWSNGQSGPVASGLCNGIYTVMVTASNGCTNNFTTSISSPAQITALSSITSPSCTLCNGSSTTTALGGVGPYTYSWTSGATGSTVNNLCAGLYQVLVTDNVGCNQIINVPISNVPGIASENFTILNEQCAGSCNGAATVQAVGGIAPITYTWLTTPAITNSVAVSLCSGNYFVQMKDAQGCIRTSSTTISSSPGLTLSPFISPPSCTGPPNGTISVIPAGGVGTYSYTWLPSGSTSQSLTNVGPGNYTVTVTDGNCTKSQAFTLSSLNNPALSYTQTNVNCFSACTGSIVALGTSTAGAVTYSWSSGALTPTLTNICPGIITLTVSSPDGCKALQSFTITDNPALQLSISNVQNVKCFGDCNGQITLIPSGGILPYTFTWSPAGVSNPQFSLCAGNYSATVIDSKGCSLTTTAAIVGPLQAIAITNTVTNSSCSTAADGSASVTVNGGTPSYTFSWSGPATFTSSAQNLNNILSGTYILNTTDASGCTKTTTLQVVPTITVDANAGRDSVFCSGGSIVLNGSNSIGASGGFNWTSISNTVSISNSPTVNVTPSVGSNTYVLMVVSSVSTCVDRDTVVVTSLAIPVVDAGPSYTISIFSSTVIGGNPTAPTATLIAWTPSGTLDNPTIPNPIASNTINTTYTVTVTDVNGCTASDTVQVFLYPEIKIPNGFSPNGDSKNDKWIIDNIGQFTENVVEVYNRWGELLFYSKGYNIPFDGRYQGKDLPVGTYYYIINLNHPAYPKPYTGPLTIFR